MMCYGTSKSDLPVTRLNKVLGYRRSNLGQVTYRWTKRSVYGIVNPRHRGSSDEIIVEHVGANMGIQIPLLVIDRRVSRSCLHGSRTRKVYTLKVRRLKVQLIPGWFW